MENKSKYIAKIKKLLRLARRTSSPEEAATSSSRSAGCPVHTRTPTGWLWR
ncbi:TPA: DUF2786 domain-containing protein [Escherichia coli]